MRFWDVNGGEIKISNENIKNINTSSLRDMESYVTQDTYLFNDTIANNIGIAKENATMEEIIEASKKASLHEFIEKLPKGYETNVGELGDSLSGGEKQRAAIARAIITHPLILICDEPTGNLDSENSHEVLTYLSKLNEEGTAIILVTHDSMIASYAKKFMYLRDGTIHTVISRNDASQEEFFQAIVEVTTQDSLRKRFMQGGV